MKKEFPYDCYYEANDLLPMMSPIANGHNVMHPMHYGNPFHMEDNILQILGKITEKILILPSHIYLGHLFSELHSVYECNKSL